MAIQWKQPQTRDRLLAAVIAASSKLDIKEIARLFSQGATYDAVEGQLRKAKKDATALKEEAAGHAGPAASAPRVRKTKATTHSPARTPVKSGRVTKSKKATTPSIKPELLAEDSLLFDATVNGTGSDEVEDEV